MTNHDDRGPEDDVRRLWQEQPIDAPPAVPLEVIQRRAAAFDRTLRFRNAREYAAGGLLALACLAGALHPVTPPGLRLAAVATLAGVGYVLWHIARYGSGSATPTPAEAVATSAHLALLRARLGEQRALLASVWRWYLAPLVPGPLILVVDTAVRASPELRATPAFWLGEARFVAPLIGVFALIAWLNAKAARKLDDEIRDLDPGERPTG